MIAELSAFDYFYGTFPRYSKTPVFKRVFDVVVSGILLFLFIPVFIGVYILMKAKSSEPVIFSQKRVGKNYKEFSMYKFRTMHVNAENQLNEKKLENRYDQIFYKFKDDERVTEVGKWLRKYNIDEIPQFYNVFKGDMSFVGNRPLPLYEAEKLTKDSTVKRFMAPAGMTGMWQVQNKKRFTTAEKRIELDNWYAENYNFLLDLKILYATLFK